MCPCRRLDGAPGGDSTYGVCQFLLSWNIQRGSADGVDLAESGPYRQLERIFLGRAGGNMPFTSNIATVLDVERAQISLAHVPGRETIRVGKLGASAVARRAEYEGTVSCGIPGHDHPGTEYVASLAVHDGSLQ